MNIVTLKRVNPTFKLVHIDGQEAGYVEKSDLSRDQESKGAMAWRGEFRYGGVTHGLKATKKVAEILPRLRGLIREHDDRVRAGWVDDGLADWNVYRLVGKRVTRVTTVRAMHATAAVALAGGVITPSDPGEHMFARPATNDEWKESADDA